MSELTISWQNKAKRWSSLVVEQRASDKTVSVFCKERGVNHHTFRYWRAKLLRSPISDFSGRFVAVAKSANVSMRSAKIILPNGVQIDLGAGLESAPVAQIVLSLCGVAHSTEGRRAKS